MAPRLSPESAWSTVRRGLSALLQPNAGRRGFKLGIRAHLVVFGLAIVVPVLLYSAILLHRYTEAEGISSQRRALSLAQALSADVDREIVAVITTLETLATSPALTSKDFTAFYWQAKQALRSRPWNVVLIDGTRRQLVNTRLPPHEAPPFSAVTEPDIIGIVQQTQQPHISDLFVGTVARKLIFSVSVPVRLDGQIPYALIMSLDTERLVEILNQEVLPEGWVAGAADGKYRIMARSVPIEGSIGRSLPEETVKRSAGQTEGAIATVDQNGQSILLAFRVSRLTGWRIAAWAPLAVVEAPLREAWNLFLLSGAGLLSLSLLTALGLGRLMSAPVAELALAGVALGQGKPVAPISSTLREADELSTVLAEAAKKSALRMGDQARLAAIVSSSPSALVSMTPDGIILNWNAAAKAIFGYEPEQVIGRSSRTFYPEGSQAEFDSIYAEVRSGQAVNMDVVRRHKDGRLLDVSISLAPMYDDGGRLVGISSIITDIGDRKARERHIEFLMREVSHRSKNLLAVVQAIAGQTARHSPDIQAFQQRFSERLHALARSHDLLVARNWQGALVADLVRVQLAPFADEASVRVSLHGPEVQLKPDALHSLTLVLHELATNAAKYGALSVPEGKITVGWELIRDPSANGSGDDRRLRMLWQETNGPAVQPPARKGFGHVVISQMAASALRGRIDLQFAPDGVRCVIEIPAGHLLCFA